MKTFIFAFAAGLMLGGAAMADGNAMKSNAMSNTTSMSNSSMSTDAMAPGKPAHKPKAKAPAKTDSMSGQGAMNSSNNAMSGQNDNAMSGDSMSGPAKPH